MDVTAVMRPLARFLRIPQVPQGVKVQRHNPCSFCRSQEGVSIAKMDYWDLSEHDLVYCEQCCLVQLDPMLSMDDLSLGCRAFYQFEKREHGLKELKRTCLRNFRKGVALGIYLKKLGAQPKRSLEVGCGDSFFSRGLKFVFPKLDAHSLDLVPEILQEVERLHGFTTWQVAPEQLRAETTGHFDIIIARDILEHVVDPAITLDALSGLLTSGGYLHFITPNGPEDFWQAYAHWQAFRKPGELLINHVSYFAPKNLKQELIKRGLQPVRWLIFDFKGVREGKGYRLNLKITVSPSTKRSALSTLEDLEGEGINLSAMDKEKVLDYWWVKWPWLAKVYCYFRHRPKWYCDADLAIGHEIDCIAQKNDLPTLGPALK